VICWVGWIAWVAATLLGSAPSAAPARAGDDASCPRRECGALVGQVRATGDRAPVAEARVVIAPRGGGSPKWSLAATTDADGRFSLPQVPAGSVELVVLREGYVRTTARLVVVADAAVAADLFVDRDPESTYRTVVQGRRDSTPGGARALELQREEIRTLPGTQGDALRALQNLPGVARPPAGLGLLVLRGAAPWQSLALFGEHPVPRAFHSLPFAGIVQSEVLERVEMVPSGASARYGPIAGGLVIMEPRRPRTDGVHGHAQIDLTGANASVEGPVGRAAYLVAARRGWVDGVLQAIEKVDDTQTFMLPGLWDYQGWVVVPAGEAEVEVRVLGAGDRVRSRYASRGLDGSLEERVTAFDFRSQFHRADLVSRWRFGRTRLFVTPSFRFQSDSAERPESFHADRREYATSARAELETPLARRARLLVGADAILSPYAGRTDPVEGPGGPAFDDVEASAVTAVDAIAAMYTIVHFGRGPWRVSPGVRAQGFAFGDTAAAAIDPRVTSRFSLGDRFALSAAVGRYSQPAVSNQGTDGNLVSSAIGRYAPTALVPGALTASFEPSLASTEAPRGLRVITGDQASATLEIDLPWELELHLGAFGRRLRDPGSREAVDIGANIPFVAVTAPIVRGFDAGAEVLLRKRLTRRLYGWLAYTGMRSIREYEGTRSPGSFDQPHNLVVLASYGLPREWRIGGRFRVASGNPYRPVLGALDLDVEEYGRQTVGLLGARNSARFPVFHQLDLRVDKRWVLHRLAVTAYVDVQNVYNRQNVEAWIYQADFRGRLGALGLPIFPSVGIRIDW
jgi:hypothetical protein